MAVSDKLKSDFERSQVDKENLALLSFLLDKVYLLR